MTTFVEDETLEPPERPDFRRVSRGVPLVMDEATGKWKRYKRASSAGNILDDDSSLVDWRIRTIVIGCAQRPDLMAQVSVLDGDANKRELRDIAEACLDAGKGTQRRNTGTAIHAMLDHVDLDHDWTPAPQFKASVDAYRSERDKYGLVPVDVEVHCVNDLFGIAGTVDRRYRTTRNLLTPSGAVVPIGTIIAGDTKTGRSLEYASGSYTTQLAAYTHPATVRYDVVTNERAAFDPPTYQEYALIMHVDAEDGRCDMYWVDLEAGRHALALAQTVREWRKRTDLIVPARAPLFPVGERSVFAPERAPESPVAPVADVPAIIPPDEALAPVRAWLRERIDRIKEAGEAATAMLLRTWPTGVAGLKFDTQTNEQLDAISEVLWNVEREYSLAFPTNDPRSPANIQTRWPLAQPFERLTNHPRNDVVTSWTRGLTFYGSELELVDALCQFAMLDMDEFTDADVTTLLDGTLRALGYEGGITDIGNVKVTDAPAIISSALALTVGTAMLMFGEDDKPVVRIIT